LEENFPQRKFSGKDEDRSLLASCHVATGHDNVTFCAGAKSF